MQNFTPLILSAVVPRVIMEGWHRDDFEEIVNSEVKRGEVTNDILGIIKVTKLVVNPLDKPRDTFT